MNLVTLEPLGVSEERRAKVRHGPNRVTVAAALRQTAKEQEQKQDWVEGW